MDVVQEDDAFPNHTITNTALLTLVIAVVITSQCSHYYDYYVLL